MLYMSRCAQFLSNSGAFVQHTNSIVVLAQPVHATLMLTCFATMHTSHMYGMCVTAFLAMCFSCRLQQLVQGCTRHE
jgi:hypothetical protein